MAKTPVLMSITRLLCIYIVLLLPSSYTCGKLGVGSGQATRLLTSELLESGQFDYKDIHEIAINDQINLHKPIIGSHHTRIAKNLDGLYDFCLDANGKGFKKRWFERSLEDSCPRKDFHLMPVPSAFNDVTSNNIVRNYMGWVWYQREIFVPSIKEPADGASWLVHFESSNYLTIVWGSIVGKPKGSSKLLASHVGGHLPFVANLTELFDDQNYVRNINRKSLNKIVLTIAISNMLYDDTIPSGSMMNLSQVVGRNYEKFKPDFDFFHFSGLIGSVNLLKLPKIHWIDVREVGASAWNMARFEACLSGPLPRSIKHSTIIGEASLLGKHNRDIKLDKCVVDLRASDKTDELCYMIEFDPVCLGEGTRLIRRKRSLHLILTLPGAEIDEYEFKVSRGIKSILDSKSGLLLEDVDGTGDNNGAQEEPVLMRGFGMHHEQFFSGRTMSLPAIMKDLNLVKWSNGNVIRTSHYPYSTAYLDACDEFGISVIAECQAVGLKSFSELKLRLHKQLLLEMMERDHSHPSIIAWSVANEPQSQLPAAKPYFEKLLSYARNELHRFTKRKPLTAAIAQSHRDDLIGHTLDFIMINHYFGWYDYTGVIEAIKKPMTDSLIGWAKLHPGKGLLISEFGADTIAGLHSFDPMSDIFSEEYQRELIVEHEKIFNLLWCDHLRKNDSIPFLGSMVWNFADFSTHDSLLRVGGNKKGLFSRDRSPKMAAHAIKRAYSTTKC